MEVIGNLCNKVPDIIEQPTDVDAGVKYIVRRFHEGIPVESQNNKNILDAYGHNSKTIKKILKKAKEELRAKHKKGAKK